MKNFVEFKQIHFLFACLLLSFVMCMLCLCCCDYLLYGCMGCLFCDPPMCPVGGSLLWILFILLASYSLPDTAMYLLMILWNWWHAKATLSRKKKKKKIVLLPDISLL